MLKRSLWLLAAVCLLVPTVPRDALAQGEVPLARKLYNEGVDALRQRQWGKAYEALRKSYDIAPRQVTLFNLAAAQRKTSRLVEASESYRRFLRETDSGQYPDYRKEARRQLSLLDREIGFLSLTITNLDEADILRLNEREYPHGAIGQKMPIDPGRYTLFIERDGSTIATREFVIAKGGGQKLAINLDQATPPDLRVRRDPRQTRTGDGPNVVDRRGQERRDDDGSIFGSPWFWVGTVVVVGLAAGATYYFTRPEELPTGTLGRGVIDLP